MAEIALFLNTAKFSGKAVSTATGILVLSAAIKVLASACKDFGSMQWSEIGKGLTSIGILLAEIATFTNLTGNAKHVISTGIALIAIAGAMKIMASAVEDFGSMQWDEIGRGLTVMAGALAEITLAVNLMPKNMVSTGVGLIAVAGALTILSNVLSTMGNFTWEEIGKGLVTMGGALAELSIALNLMNGTLAGSAALLIASASLAVLAPVLSILGAMSWEAIAKGLVSLAGIGGAGVGGAPATGVRNAPISGFFFSLDIDLPPYSSFMSKNVSQFEPHFQPKSKAEVVLDFGLIVVIHCQWRIEQRSQQISTDVADFGGVSVQALKDVDHHGVVQPIETGLHLRQRDVIAADPNRLLGGTHHICHQPDHFVHIVSVELLTKKRVLDILFDLSQILASIHPSRLLGGRRWMDRLIFIAKISLIGFSIITVRFSEVCTSDNRKS